MTDTSLTPRQQDLAALIVARLSQREIATRLGITVRTVKKHTAQLAARLGCSGPRLAPCIRARLAA